MLKSVLTSRGRLHSCFLGLWESESRYTTKYVILVLYNSVSLFLCPSVCHVVSPLRSCGPSTSILRLSMALPRRNFPVRFVRRNSTPWLMSVSTWSVRTVNVHRHISASETFKPYHEIFLNVYTSTKCISNICMPITAGLLFVSSSHKGHAVYLWNLWKVF